MKLYIRDCYISKISHTLDKFGLLYLLDKNYSRVLRKTTRSQENRKLMETIEIFMYWSRYEER